MVKSRFNGGVYFGILFLLVIDAVTITVVASNLSDPKKNYSDLAKVGQVIIAIILLLVPGGYILSMIKRIIVTPSQILIKSLFKTKIIEASDIKLISLFHNTGDASNEGSAIRIKLTKGKPLVVINLFTNIHDIKQALTDNFKDKINPLPVKQQGRWQNNLPGDVKKFAGNPHVSSSAIAAYIVFILVLVIDLTNSVKPIAFFITLLLPLLFFIAGVFQLYYFESDGKHLIIKNHLFSWIKKQYDFSDILFLQLEDQPKKSKALRIFTSDFKSKSYSAGSPRDKHWKALVTEMKARGMTVKQPQ